MSTSSSKYGTGADLARALGLSERMVGKYRDRGLFSGSMGGPGHTPYDIAKCVALVELNRDPEAALKGQMGAEAATGVEASVPSSPLTKARTAKTVYEAQARKMQLDRLSGSLISKADATAAVRAAITVITERLDGAAGQIGPRVAGNPSAAECERIAREILRGIRAEIAGMATALETVGLPDAT